MKYSVAILALAAAVTAQKIESCDGKAQPCIDSAIADSGLCDEGDEACACENMSEIQGDATACVIEACGGADKAQRKKVDVIDEVKQYCAALPADGGDEEAEPTDGGDEEAAPTEGGEEPATTDGGDASETSEAAAPSGEPAATESAGNGTSASDTPTAGARALAPVGALLVGLFALAL